MTEKLREGGITKEELFGMETGYDPIALGKIIEEVVTRREGGSLYRKYYRFRGGRWYGGIATADAVGCNLKCKFCWSWRQRDSPRSYGEFYSPEAVAERLSLIAEEKGYSYVRISGGEPTLGFEHLLGVLRTFRDRDKTFILETNGIYLGYSRELAQELSPFVNLHVRVSIKGCNSEEFFEITGARQEFFELQIRALENLLDAGVEAHPAVMMSFSGEESCRELKERLGSIDPSLEESFEEEYVFLYPHVVELMNRHGIWPKKAFSPDGIPREFI
ncbi:MAG: radical SAM protein [Fervidicoccaceae archaeon]|jgi:uncharacterized Fe-S cluster-containing radical SAM superfamily protein